MDVSVLRSAQSYLGSLSTALDSEYPVNPIQPLGHSSAVSVTISVSVKPNQKVYMLLWKHVTMQYQRPSQNTQWRSMGKQKGSELHHRGEFLHNYYTFESVNDGDHDGVVRIFVGFSCKP